MAGESVLARAVKLAVRQRLQDHKVVKLGMVTAVNSAVGDFPATLTVAGSNMAYSDAITTPLKGDTVAYLVAEKFVIARRA